MVDDTSWVLSSKVVVVYSRVKVVSSRIVEVRL